MSIPHKTNFCGGNFQDWLEVNLIKDCDASCSWCVEKRGWHPKHKASWEEIADAAIETGKKNIILLGGEPLLYKDLYKVIHKLKTNDCNVWVTTNGSQLKPQFAANNLHYLSGINISIHHYDLKKNAEITGVHLNHNILRDSLAWLKDCKIRLNCNCIRGYIDSEDECMKYLEFAKSLNVSSVRFAELKFDNEDFIDLAKKFDYRYGLNDDPYTHGCNCDAEINGVAVNFRQMCGLQTNQRPMPVNPEQCEKKVLYYDGKVYNGWQTKGKKMVMSTKGLALLLEKVKSGESTVAEAAVLIDRELRAKAAKTVREVVVETPASGGCHY